MVGSSVRASDMGIEAWMIDPHRLVTKRGYLSSIKSDLKGMYAEIKKEKRHLKGRVKLLNVKLRRLDGNSSQNIFIKLFTAIDKFFTRLAVKDLNSLIKDTKSRLQSIRKGTEFIDNNKKEVMFNARVGDTLDRF